MQLFFSTTGINCVKIDLLQETLVLFAYNNEVFFCIKCKISRFYNTCYLFLQEQNSEGSSSPRCGPKFGGQKFSRCSPPFGFVHPGLFGGFPAYTCETGQKVC